MSEHEQRVPLLHRFYREYLDDEVSSRFIKSVSRHYTVETLERLAQCGGVVSRRSAVLALGFLASYKSNPIIAAALCDSDRAVRLLAEHGIRQVWFRDGSAQQQKQLQAIARLNQTLQFQQVINQATHLIDSAPEIAETWNQRAIAYFNLDRFEESLVDCQQSLNRNPYHYSAIVGKGHCFLNMDLPFKAVECFERALDVHPGLDGVRTHLQHLKKTL